MTYTRDNINHILSTNPRAVERGIIRLFELQTEDEKRHADTKYDNTVGFCSADARPGTRFARWMLGFDDNNVKRFQPKSLNHPKANKVFGRYLNKHDSVQARALSICLKHSRQLTAIANGKDPRRKG